MGIATDTPRYPRLQPTRWILRRAIRLALNALADVQVEGRENIPSGGPLLVVANHFSFLDPVAMIYITSYPLEFLAGAETPNAPRAVSWLRKLWGVFPVHRGSASRSALRSAQAVLGQDGVVGVFPEAGSWAQVLRPARPGSAYLAASSGARILPMGFTGLADLFENIRRGKRGKVRLKIGSTFGPFHAAGRGRQRRKQLDQISRQIMEHIAELLPEESRGHFSDDPEIRAAAAGTEIYPWDSQFQA